MRAVEGRGLECPTIGFCGPSGAPNHTLDEYFSPGAVARRLGSVRCRTTPLRGPMRGRCARGPRAEQSLVTALERGGAVRAGLRRLVRTTLSCRRVDPGSPWGLFRGGGSSSRDRVSSWESPSGTRAIRARVLQRPPIRPGPAVSSTTPASSKMCVVITTERRRCTEVEIGRASSRERV